MRVFVLRKSSLSKFLSYAFPIVLAIVVGLILRLFILEVYKVPTGSMIPTLLPGDHIAVLKTPLFFNVNKLVRGDVVVFEVAGESIYYVKRVLALPSDSIEIEKEKIRINKKSLEVDFFDQKDLYKYLDPGQVVYKECSYDKHKCYNVIYESNLLKSTFYDYKDSAQGCFLMGDNRTNSYDSRELGEVDKSKILGKVFIIWFSVEPFTKRIRWERIGKRI